MDRIQFEYRPNRCALDAVASIWLLVSNSLNNCKSVCALYDYVPALDDVPRSLFLLSFTSFVSEITMCIILWEGGCDKQRDSKWGS